MQDSCTGSKLGARIHVMHIKALLALRSFATSLVLLSPLHSEATPRSEPIHLYKDRTSLNMLREIKKDLPRGAQVQTPGTATCAKSNDVLHCTITYIIKRWPNTADVQPEVLLQSLVLEYLKRCASETCASPAKSLREVRFVKIVQAGRPTFEFVVP